MRVVLNVFFFHMLSSHPLAQQQIDAVDKVLKELDIESIPKLVVWNKVSFYMHWTSSTKNFNDFNKL